MSCARAGVWLALVCAVATAALAGGPEPGARQRVLGTCGNGQACIADGSDVFNSCDEGDVDDNTCNCTDEKCAVVATAAFTGELTITVNEQPCPGDGARITMSLVGQSDLGTAFSAATAGALDFCGVDVATACDPDIHGTPFYCVNEFSMDRFSEQAAYDVGPEWLVLHPLPGTMADQIRPAFALAGDEIPVIARAESCGSPEGTPAPDGQPVVRRFCVKGHFVSPSVPIPACDPREPCIAGTIPASGGRLRGTTVGVDPAGLFTGSCGGADSPEVLYDWTPDREGVAVISTVGLTTNFSTAVYVRSGPCSALAPGSSGDIACNADFQCGLACCNTGADDVSIVTLDDVTPGQQYCIVVDSRDREAGNFDLTVYFCDAADVVTLPGDAHECASAEECGIGVGPVESATTAPASAPVARPLGGGACTSPCCVPLCGDGERDPGEDCDDGNAVVGDGCEPDCRRSTDFTCSGGAVATCGGSPCLLTPYNESDTCCSSIFSGSCTEPDGSLCTVDFPDTCCTEPSGRTCCRNAFEDTIVCTEPGGGECRTDLLGDTCVGDGASCSECRHDLSDCGLSPFMCFKAGQAKGGFCRHTAPVPGTPCGREEDCGGATGVTTHCTDNRFVARSVVLENILADEGDPFEATYVAIRPETLCVPAGTRRPGAMAEPPLDPVTSLEGYKIRIVGSSSLEPRDRTRVADQFLPSGFLLDIRGVDRLLVPTARRSDAPSIEPDLESHRLDDYKCYRVAPAKKYCALDPGGPRCNKDVDCGFDGPCVTKQPFPKGIEVVVTDAFQSRAYMLKKQSRLCGPTGTDGDLVREPRRYLACYEVKPAKTLCAADPTLSCERHVPQRGIFGGNRFGEERLDTKTEAELCVPASVDLPNGVF